MELAHDVNNPHLNAMPPLQSQIQSGQRASQQFVSHPRKESLNKFFARITAAPYTWRARSVLASEKFICSSNGRIAQRCGIPRETQRALLSSLAIAARDCNIVLPLNRSSLFQIAIWNRRYGAG
jgi:hypothetical protein